MITRSLLIALVALVFARSVAAVESEESLAAERARLHKSSPAEFAPVVDDPALPRVLLIGDSISIGYTLPVRAKLQGVANVHRAFENCGTTARGLQELDQWLGDGHWAVIHFNFGLHDIAYLDQKAPRISPAAYEANLRTLVQRMRATKAHLVFATMTPVPVIKEGPERHSEDAIAYNAIARRVMRELGVTVDDLYAFIAPRCATVQLPNNVHFTAEGYAALAEPVTATIRSALSAHVLAGTQR